MKPRLIALNVLLLVSLLGIAWQTRVQWQAAQQARRTNLNVPVKPVPVPPLTPAATPEPAAATKYADVAGKNLFSKDRNANIIVDPPKIEVPKPMPALPVVLGVMGLPSGTKAIMAEKPGAPSTTVRKGETLGEFKIVALDTQNITLEWNGKEVTRKIDDLIDRSGGQTAAAAGQGGQNPPPPSGPAMPAPPPPNTQNLASNTTATASDMGNVMTPNMRDCKPGDTTPVGTVVDGFRKTNISGIVGTMCRWIKQ